MGMRGGPGERETISGRFLRKPNRAGKAFTLGAKRAFLKEGDQLSKKHSTKGSIGESHINIVS